MGEQAEQQIQDALDSLAQGYEEEEGEEETHYRNARTLRCYVCGAGPNEPHVSR